MIKRPTFCSSLLLLILVLVPAAQTWAAVFYAKPAATGSANGLSWANAMTLADALNAATSGDEVWVMQGTHLPTRDQTFTLSPTDPRDVTFAVKSGVEVYGGFAGTETLLSQRNVLSNLTVLSGDIGVTSNSADNAYHVAFFGNNLANTTRLDGFRITAGNANVGGAFRNTGGGIFVRATAAAVSPQIARCVVIANNGAVGGGLYISNATPALSRCVFVSNTATVTGGGIHIVGSSATLDANPAFTNCVIAANTAPNGGGVYNTATGGGTASGTWNSCTLWGNSASSGSGGGFFNIQTSSTANPAVNNSIVWGNTATANTGQQQFFNNAGTGSAFHSIFEGGLPTGVTDDGNNFGTDPLFVSTSDLDGADNTWRTADDGLRLLNNSPCVNTGTGVNAPLLDIVGTARPQGAGVDIGAYENLGICSPVATATDNMTWNGSFSSDWGNACNWTPNGVPTATNIVIVDNVANDPVVFSGTIANCTKIYINSSGNITINSGGTLNVLNTVSALAAAIDVYNSAVFINNGTLNIQTPNVSVHGINLSQASFTNTGTTNINLSSRGVFLLNSNPVLSNNSTGVINFQGGCRGIDYSSGFANQTVNNQGIINYQSSSNYALVGANGSGYTFTNSGTFNVTTGLGIISDGITVTNNACARIIMSAGNYDNTATGSITTNNGLIQLTGNLNNSQTFTNNNTLKYGSLTGTVSNTGNASIRVNNTPTPIFTYGGTYNGTVSGIFTDAAATISAGTFTAPNTFVPSGLAAGLQTLYAKITPNGGACTYIVPFTYDRIIPSVNIAITTGSNPACNGSSVTFTATPTHGGGGPTYQWTKNNANISGATNAAYTGIAGTDFVSTDVIACNMVSNNPNAIPTTASSNSITMTVNAIFTRLYVNANATGSNNGTSWANAYTDFQSALGNCFSTNAEIWVAAGTYKPTTGTNRSISFIIPSNIKVYGGFAGTETLLSQRPANVIGGGINATILSGDIGIQGNNSDNTRNIVNLNNGNINTELNGFVIEYANFPDGTRGAITATDGGGWVRNCVMRNNNGYAFAAFSFKLGSDGGIENCFIVNNTSDYSAAGIETSILQVNNCVFANNTTTNEASDLQFINSYSVVLNCTFYGTSTGGTCAILAQSPSGIPSISNSVVWTGQTHSFEVRSGVTFISNECVVKSGKTGSGTWINGSTITANPLFVNVTDIIGADNLYGTADDGLQILYTSPARNAGASNSLTTDIVGTTRPTATTYDIGAYENPTTASVTPSVTIAITTGSNPTCAGNSLTFTATPTNGGTNPTYQWTKNNINISGATNATYTGIVNTNFVHTDVIACTMQSNSPSASPLTATSTGITLTVNAPTTPGVSIAIPTGTNPVCSGSSLTFTATPTNGGSTPTYTWLRNGSTQLATGSSPTYTGVAGVDFFDNDQVTCQMTSSAACPSPSMANSAALTLDITSPFSLQPIANQAICQGQTATFHAIAQIGDSVETALGLTIPDGGVTGLSAPATLAGTGLTVSSQTIVEATIRVNHTYLEDIDVYLIGPGNCGSMELSTDNGGSGDDYISTTFRTGYPVSILTGAAPFTGAFAPEGNLSTPASGAPGLPATALIGCPVDGTWHLRVVDDEAMTIGSLIYFDLKITHPRTLTSATLTSVQPNAGLPVGGLTGQTSYTITPAAAGMFTYTLSATEGGCNTSISTQVEVIALATRRYVKANATGANNGTSWADAYTNLQSALNNTCFAPNAEIWVAAGTYTPTADINRTIAFAIPAGIKVYGGFAGTETLLSQRPANIVGGGTNATILSGDIGTPNNNSDNTHNIVRLQGNATTELNGFIIEGANFSSGNRGAVTAQAGGGGVLRNCILRNNTGYAFSAFHYTGGAVGSIENCVITNNSGDYGAAGIDANTHITLNNCVFAGNSTNNESADLNIINNNSIANNCTFYGTSTGGSCAILVQVAPANPTLRNCIVWSGHAHSFELRTGVTLTTDFCIIKGSKTGSGTWTNTNGFATDPGFTNIADLDGADNLWGTADDGLNLVCPSIAKDAGTATDAPATDIVGTARPQAMGIDIGAYETTSNTPFTPAISIAITSGQNPTCVGGTVGFTATPTFGGTTPVYQWTKNNVSISGANLATYTGIMGTDFTDTDIIRCELTSNASCVSPTAATSTGITTTVNTNLTTTGYSVCQNGTVAGGLAATTPGSGIFPLPNFTGNTTGGPTYNRPLAVAQGGLCTNSNFATAVRYGAHTFRAANTGAYTFSTCGGASFDTHLMVYQNPFNPATACAGNTLIAANDDVCGSQSTLNVNLIAGVDYTVVVSGFNNTNFGAYTIFSIGNELVGPNIDWYTAASGGTAIGTGATFNPVGVAGSGIPNTATPGSTTFYAEAQGSPCTRVPSIFTIESPRNRLYVRANASGANNGTTWADAYTDMQSALSNTCVVASPEIWVASGGYTPSAYPQGCSGCNTIQDYTFYLRDGLRVYGGFSGTETLLSQRNISANPTTLLGELGDPMNPNDNTFHVVLMAGPNSGAAGTTLDGFNITGGRALGTGTITIAGAAVDRGYGGGVSTRNGNQTIQNVGLVGNNAIGGGGLCTEGSTTTCSQNNFSNCVGDFGGGATFINGSVDCNNNAFTSNNATSGAGIYSIGNHSIANNTLTGNTATQYGGGVYATTGIANLNANVFLNNQATQGGGGIDAQNASALISNCIFYQNSGANGGAVSLRLGTNQLINSVLIGNNAFATAGALYTLSGTQQIKNTIFRGNTQNNNAGVQGAEYASDGANGNTFEHNSFQLSASNYPPNNGSAYGIGTAATQNIFAQNPLFTLESDPNGADNLWGTSDDGLQLACGSPSINAGTNTGAPATDIVGRARPQFATADMGAYESRMFTSTMPTPIPTLAGVTRTANAECNDDSGWTHYFESVSGERVLSLQKGTEAIGFAGDAGFTVSASTRSAYGSGAGLTITAPYVLNPGGWSLMHRWWNVSPLTQPAAAVQVRTYFTAQDRADINGSIAGTANDLSLNQLWFYKVNDASPDLNLAQPHNGLTAASSYDQPGYWEYANGPSASASTWRLDSLATGGPYYAEYTIRSFSGGGGAGTLGGTGAGSTVTFPVTFTDVAAYWGDPGMATVQWATVTEENTRQFNIERSPNGQEWHLAGATAATGAGRYTFADPAMVTSERVMYRIRALDADGTETLSATTELFRDPQLAPVRVWPNPVTDHFFVQSQQSILRLRLWDIQGKEVVGCQVTATNGVASVILPSGMAAGVYQLEVVTDQQRTVFLIEHL